MKDAPQKKPALRGVSHQIAFFVALVAAATLVLLAPSSRAALAAAIYGASLATMFGVSALYHRPTWTPERRRWLRRLDHSAIFLFIAGSFTPLCALALEPSVGQLVLTGVWIGAAIGIIKTLAWLGSPRWVTAAIYVALGASVLAATPQVVAAIGLSGFALLAGGGVAYIAGAAIYAAKRPDPFPRYFGYHEIFHALVIVASVLHFVVLSGVVMRA